MKIIFVENRALTRLWSEISDQLISAGHEVHWIVQNRLYKPKAGFFHYLNIRSNTSKKCENSEKYPFLKKSDRGIYYNGGNDKHYCKHDDRINEILKEVRPDFIFGECTQYHELLTIYNAKRLSIPYLTPFPSRYPINRFFFYLYDTFEPVCGSREQIKGDDIEKMIADISTRSVVLPYMKKKDSHLLLRLGDMFRLFLGWINGERHITPSPFKRILNNRLHLKNYNLWEALSKKEIPVNINNIKKVLYPMQMQPESNIDVYGQPWNDQSEIIKRIAQSLKKYGYILVVKPNPKSKYELNKSLISIVKNNSNIIALSHSVSMSSVIGQVDTVLTVTGTILLECIFSKKRVICLGDHLMSKYPGVAQINKPEDILRCLVEDECNTATNQESKQLLSELYEQSYNGNIFDPISNPELMNQENIKALSEAFEGVMKDYFSIK